MSMITATTWVPRGFPAPLPTKYAVDDDELQRISKLAKLKLDDAKEDLEDAKVDKMDKDDDADDDDDDNSDSDDELSGPGNGVKIPQSAGEADDDLREYDLDNYDSEPDASGEQPHGIFGNTTSLAYHTSNTEDPYITLKDDDASDSEREELQVLATDNMVLAARVEDEVAHLEVYVYEDEDDNLYVHHDIMLPAIPLCVEWLSIGAGKNASGAAVDQSANANYVAVGTMDPDIEIWDLDTIDCMYPNAILGQGGEDNTMVTEAESGKKKKPRKKTKKANENYHVDAVLSLAANRNHRTLLASASADKTVKLWDLATCKCAQSYNYHTDKVCSLDWHPTDTATLLSGSYDRTVVVSEMRAPAANKPRWGVESDVEQVRWNPHDPNYFFVSTEDGYLHYHDIRTAPSTPEKSKPVWKLKAHDKALSSFDINPSIPNLLATGSQDKETKLWSLSGMGPSLVVGRNLGVGKVFSTTWAPDQEVGFRLAVAGSKGSVQVWDTSTNPAIRQAFSGKVKPIQGDVKERLVGIQEDSSDDSDDSEDDEDDDEGAGKDGWESMDED